MAILVKKRRKRRIVDQLVAAHNQPSDSRNTSDTRVESRDQQRNDVSGVVVDPEKGKDVSIVT
jgi:DHA1 family multidrug resistance protein-like MFS transporter